MSTTVAVTLITAISTLAGAGLSGYVAFLISRTQVNAQTKVSDNQRLEQRSIERRQIRRDAYLQFLNQLGLTEQIVENAWQADSPSASDLNEISHLVQPARHAVSEIRRLTNVVILEGPLPVSNEALRLAALLTLECADIVRAAKSTPQGESICLHNQETFMKAIERRGKSKLALISAARKSLDEIFDTTILATRADRTERKPSTSSGSAEKPAKIRDAPVDTSPETTS